ncbi:MAG: ATP phosphoribosyltransferase regulatory subunit [Nanoarchaeota archaeon]|nr:ATP phosphoribosyltransferase regulatory subunit [Nanoarchaeota archaeon]
METIKGFKDYVGEEAKKRAEIKKILVETFEKYGYEPAETPVIEAEEFVRGENSNDEAVSDIYKLEDKGKRKLALRYEFTFQLKRLMQNKKLPYKRYQLGEVFRDEPVSSNRFRQFVQSDIDTIGSTIKDDAEILALTKEVLEKLGIKFKIYVGNRALLNEILEANSGKISINSSGSQIKELEIKSNQNQILREIDKLDKLPEAEIKSNLKKYKAENLVNILKKPEKYFEKYKNYKDISELKKYCKNYGVGIVFQPSLVRGLSYYNKNVFEIKTPESRETIVGGGSYIFNGIQSTGISFGLDRLSSLANIDYEKEKYLIISLEQDKDSQKSKISNPASMKNQEEAINIANKLRKKNKIVNLFYGKPSKALEYANSYKFSKVIFVGEKEIKNKKFMVKDMKTGKEKQEVF